MTDIDLSLFPHTVEALDGNEQRAKVFLDRYAMKGDDGRIIETTPEGMWARVAAAIADGEQPEPGTLPSARAYEFYNLLRDFKFVPGGRILSGAGTGTEVTFYNCYVIPVETRTRRASREDGLGLHMEETGNDSREAIIDTIGVMVDIMTRGGGVGINWSVLRPAGTHLKRINATSSGPIDWMHLASTAVGTVEQGGSRRGAAMFMLDDWHPDVMAFIDAKRDLTRITNANISVAVSDDFMRLVEQDGEWDFAFPDTSHPAYDAEWDGDLEAWLEKGYPLVQYGTIKAREMWRKLAEAAWDNGEPGVVFLDRYNKQSTAQGVERLISVNPCGEQGLGPYSVCNLGAMNLSAYARAAGERFTETPGGTRTSEEWNAFFDYDAFRRDVKLAVRFLDRVIDENYYFLPENERIQKELRRIGLSVMGLADALVKLGYRYGSPEAVEFTEAVFSVMKESAIEASIDLAEELGPAPAWDKSMMQRPYLFSSATNWKRLEEFGLRNLFLLTQAPTGTTSILAGVNSGIEPFFATGYWREDRTGKHYVIPAALEGQQDENGFWAPHVVTANEVTVEEHIAMQAAVQKYVDSSVSKTINAPNSHTVEDVGKAYTLAYRSGLKGLAYFRDGCGRAQVLSTEKPEMTPVADLGPQLEQALADLAVAEAEVDRKEQVILDLQSEAKPFERPDSLTGRTHKVRAGTQTAYVTVNRSGDEPVEVFVSVGKSGTGMMEMGEAMGRLASIGLQRGVPLLDIIDQLDGVGNNGPLNRSLPSAIASALTADIEAESKAAQKVDRFMGSVANLVINVSEGNVEAAEAWAKAAAKPMHVTIPREQEVTFESSWGPETEEWLATIPQVEVPAAADLCPDCGGYSLVREEGCKKCHACGYSAC